MTPTLAPVIDQAPNPVLDLVLVLAPIPAIAPDPGIAPALAPAPIPVATVSLTPALVQLLL